jgi:cytochrome c oxidase subunit 2
MTRAALLAAGLVLLTAHAIAQEQAPNRRDFTIVAQDNRFTPDRIEVSQDDLVKITLQSDERPHSFVIDAYRIVKRVAGGQSISFEFRADQAGTFEFYCNLSGDPGCQEMKGTLVVKGKQLQVHSPNGRTPRREWSRGY